MDNSQFQDEENFDMPAPLGHPPYNKKGDKFLGGRPREWTDELIEIEAEAFREWLGLKTSFWYEQFAIERGYPDSYLVLFSKRNESFRAVYEFAKSWQKSRLVMGGLLNKFNSNITKLVLFNTCGWSDKQETKLSGSAENPLEFIMKNIDGTSRGIVNEEQE